MTRDQLFTILTRLRTGLAYILGPRLEAVYLYSPQARGSASMNPQIEAILEKAQESLEAARLLVEQGTGIFPLPATKELDPNYHKYMIAAQDFRSQGDYAYGEGVSLSHTNSAIEWANEFLEAAKAFISQT